MPSTEPGSARRAFVPGNASRRSPRRHPPAGSRHIQRDVGSDAHLVGYVRSRTWRPGATVVANIRPQPAGDCLALRQHRYRCVVAMNALGRQHMIPDQRNQRAQRCRAGAHPVRQCGDIEINPLACICLALAIERLVIAELGVQDHRQAGSALPDPGRSDGTVPEAG